MLKRIEKELVQGWLHAPPAEARAAIVLTHGAGASCEAPFLVAAAKSLSEGGNYVLRYDLPFRQTRSHGPGTFNSQQQVKDRQGIVRAAEELRRLAPGLPLILSGHSYGGRQCSMVAAEDPCIAQALLLLSYPLHPTRAPEKLRIEHFPKLQTRCVFVHGTRDPFGTIEEMEAALTLIRVPKRLHAIERGPHNLPLSAAALLPAWLSAIMEE